MTHGYQENVTVDEGTGVSGVNTKLHFEGDSLIVQRSYDAEPHLQYAAAGREAQNGKRWGEGRLVGHIPPLEYAKFLTIKDNSERQKAVKAWLRVNNKFVMYDRYLK